MPAAMTASSSLLQTSRCPRLAKSTVVSVSSSISPLSARVRSPHRHVRPFFHRAAAAALGQAFSATSENSGATHTLSTVRTLPYADHDLFHIIADVDAYDDFLPHCTLSRVTRWRRQKPQQQLYQHQHQHQHQPQQAPSFPSRADLTVGWGPLSQTYSSRVYCIPSRGIVEAVSGQYGMPTLTTEEQAELGEEEDDVADKGVFTSSSHPSSTHVSGENDPFVSLVTRWTVKALDERQSSRLSLTLSPSSLRNCSKRSSTETVPWSRVELRIRFQFQNPLYQLAAAQVGNEMATKMIEAFEQRAETLLGSPQPRL